jgi:hypothetical protein
MLAYHQYRRNLQCYYEFDWNSNNLPDTEGWEQIFAESYEKSKARTYRWKQRVVRLN